MKKREQEEANGVFKPQSKTKTRTKAQQSITSKIMTKVQASVKVLDDIKGSQYEIVEDTYFDPNKQAIVKTPYSYEERRLLRSEVNFYTQNSTALGVLQTLDHYVQEENIRTWELFPTTHFSPEQIQG